MDHLTDPTKPIRDEKDQSDEPSPVLLSAGDESGLSGEEVDKAPIPLKVWLVVALCVIAQYNLTFYAIAPPANSYSIAGPLNAMDKRMWIAQCQGIPAIVTGPILAIISDLYGRRWVVIPAFLMMIVANIISMTAKNIEVILVAQTMMGIAYGVSPITYAIPSEIVPSRYRSWVQTAIGVGASFSAVTALLGMGAAINADPVDGWRWIFRSSLIGNVIITVGFFVFYKPPPRAAAPTSLWTRFKTLDWIGYFLLFAGLVPFLMGFAWASDRNFGWKDPHAYGCVAAGTVGFLACLLYEWKGRSDGFIHHELFRHGPNFPIAVFLIAVEGALFYMINNIWSVQIITLYTTDTIILGCYIIPFFLAVTVISPFISAYVVKTRDTKWPIVVGFVFFLGAIIGFGTATENSKKAVLGYITLAGVGFSAPLIFVISLVQLSTPPLYIGITTALTISARVLGGTVGYAIAEVIYSSQTNEQVPAAIAQAVLPAGFDPTHLGQLIGAILSGQGIAAVPGGTPEIIGSAFAAAKHVQARGFRIVWLTAIPAVVLAIVAACLFKNPKERMNWSVDAPLRAATDSQAPQVEVPSHSLDKREKGTTEHVEDSGRY